MTRSEDELRAAANAALDAFMRDIDQRIASVEMPGIPRPVAGDRKGDEAGAEAIVGLGIRIQELRARVVSSRIELARLMAEAEDAVRANEDEHAKQVLERFREQAQQGSDAELLLIEYEAMVAELRQLFSKPQSSASP